MSQTLRRIDGHLKRKTPLFSSGLINLLTIIFLEKFGISNIHIHIRYNYFLQGFKTVPPESLISENAKKALENFLKHGDFGRTEIGPQEVFCPIM